jgi:hypothetical protein
MPPPPIFNEKLFAFALLPDPPEHSKYTHINGFYSFFSLLKASIPPNPPLFEAAFELELEMLMPICEIMHSEFFFLKKGMDHTVYLEMQIEASHKHLHTALITKRKISFFSHFLLRT